MSDTRMNQDQSNSLISQKSWLGKLGQVFMGEPRDRDQLIEMLRDAQQRHLLDPDALAMIEGVLEVSEMQVRDIMLPRTQMVVVERNSSLEKILPIITESAHSRFPVLGDSKDEVVGILLAKDLLAYFLDGGKSVFNVWDMLRPAVFIPESKRLNVLLKDFRASRNHMAIVVDEYGGVNGLVTIEDVLEQIVGEIVDEHDIDEADSILEHSDTHFTVKALTSIDDFNTRFGSQFSNEEIDTIGGLVSRELGHLPKRGEIIDIGHFKFKVLHADNRRIHLLQLTLCFEEKVS